MTLYDDMTKEELREELKKVEVIVDFIAEELDCFEQKRDYIKGLLGE